MKTISREEIQSYERVYRLNLVNCISGYKAANLIGTKGEFGENLSIISSVIHLGSNPAILGFIMRPDTVERHTLKNIKEQGYYTINQISEHFIEQAHYTSANFAKEESEFEKCKLASEYHNQFQAPFVKESQLKMAMKLEEIIPIEINNTALIVGSVEFLRLNENSLQDNGQLDLNAIKAVCISGLNRYHKVEEIGKFPYARPTELPTFA